MNNASYYNSAEFKNQTEDFFSRRVNDNANRPEYVYFKATS